MCACGDGKCGCRGDPSCLHLVFRLRGTVICRIWWQVLLCALWALSIALLHHFRPDYHLHVESQTLQGASIVVGMLLVFRTNTAYDRFWEGRKIWAELIHNTRTLSRTIWVYIDDQKDPKLLVEKVTVMNMLVAYVYAVKHYIREEYSYQEEDIKDFMGHLPKMFLPSSNERPFQHDNVSAAPVKVIQNRQKAQLNKLKEDLMMKPEKSGVEELEKRHSFTGPPPDSFMETNIPLEISYFITSYIVSIKERSLVDNPICRVVDTAVGNLIRCLSSLERIRRTPIPVAYAVHLHHVTWIMVMILPFQWTQELKFMSVFAVTLASFAMLGILSIAREIENPFGYDYNDLNLDDYCHSIHKEIMALMSRPMPKPHSWIDSDMNRPIVTDYEITAPQLMKMSYKKVLGLLDDGKNHQFKKGRNSSVYSFHVGSQTELGSGDHKV